MNNGACKHPESPKLDLKCFLEFKYFALKKLPMDHDLDNHVRFFPKLLVELQSNVEDIIKVWFHISFSVQKNVLRKRKRERWTWNAAFCELWHAKVCPTVNK